jgi:hypothetical protein
MMTVIRLNRSRETLPTCGGGCERQRAGGGFVARRVLNPSLLTPTHPSPVEGEGIRAIP